MKDIKIKPALNGWIVEVGCKKVVFNSLREMIDEIKAYIADPEEAEKHYMDNAVNEDKTNNWPLSIVDGKVLNEYL